MDDRLEELRDPRTGELMSTAERYVAGPHAKQIAYWEYRSRDNVYAFSAACASLEVLQWLSMSVAPQGIADVGTWNFHFVTGNLDVSTASCKPTCCQAANLAKGDHASPGAPTGAHAVAHREIDAREHERSRARLRALEFIVSRSQRAADRLSEFVLRQ